MWTRSGFMKDKSDERLFKISVPSYAARAGNRHQLLDFSVDMLMPSMRVGGGAAGGWYDALIRSCAIQHPVEYTAISIAISLEFLF